MRLVMRGKLARPRLTKEEKGMSRARAVPDEPPRMTEKAKRAEKIKLKRQKKRERRNKKDW